MFQGDLFPIYLAPIGRETAYTMVGENLIRQFVPVVEDIQNIEDGSYKYVSSFVVQDFQRQTTGPEKDGRK